MAQGGTVVAQEIGLTEDEVLAAALAALGLSGAAVGANMEERVLTEYRAQIRARGRLVSAREVANALQVNPSTVTQAATRLVSRGRMLRTMNGDTSRAVYVPAPEK